MANKRVIVHLSGGLGNQMFQYMAGVALAKNSRKELVINLNWFLNPRFAHRNSSVYLTKRKVDILQFETVAKTKVDWLPTPRDGRMERFVAFISLSKRESLGVISEFNFKTSLINKNYKTRRLFGFFMSPKFFLNITPETIFNELNPSLTDWPHGMRELLKSQISIGVHIRLGDYVSLGDKVIPSEIYFLSGIERLVSILGKDAKIYFFTDEPERLKNLFPKLTGRGVTVSPPSSTTPVENLIVLSSCTAYVCSNSTFSWWGAALSDAPKSLVVRPSYFYTAKPDEDSHADLWAISEIRLNPITGKEE